MVGQHELAELAPRDVVAKGIHRVLLADRRRPRLPGRPAPRRRVPGAAVPDHHGVHPGGRRRPGDRADPGRAGRALRLRRRTDRPGRAHQHPRPVRVRRGGLHRRARRQPAGQQLAAGGPGLRPADRRRHRPRPAAAGRAGAAGRRAPAWVADPAIRSDLQRRDDPGRGRAALGRLAGRHGQGTGPAGRAAGHPAQRGLGGDEPADRRVGAGRLGARPARRPAAATGGRTSRSPRTSGAATCWRPGPGRPADRGLRGDAR